MPRIPLAEHFEIVLGTSCPVKDWIDVITTASRKGTNHASVLKKISAQSLNTRTTTICPIARPTINETE